MHPFIAYVSSLNQSDLLALTLFLGLAIYFLLNKLSDRQFSSLSPFNLFSSSDDGANHSRSKGFPATNSSSANPSALKSGLSSSNHDLGDPRDFVHQMKLQNKKTIVFYGSQTGTAEDFATRLAKEVKSRFGLSSLVADPDEYDFDHLDQLTSENLVIFVLATYGEGEPTDNAVALFDFLNDDSNCEDLSMLRYVIFALGDRTYEKFCATGMNADALLSKRGAQRIGELGMGDDDKSMEEDYLAWKDPMFEELQKVMVWEEGQGGDVADFLVREIDVDNPQAELQYKEAQIYRGELSSRVLMNMRGVIDAKNPYPAPVSTAKELFVAGERNCVHVEFDIKDTGIRYQAGDHLAVWPMNPDAEVETLMNLLGLWEKKDTALHISSLDPLLAKVPFPTPASYVAIFRHYLDISSTVSRQLLASLSQFAPTPASSAALKALGTDKELYMSKVASLGRRLGETLMMVTDQQAGGESADNFREGVCKEWNIPMDRIISGLPRLQPRFYSISSSPKLYPDTIHITAVVLKYPSGGRLNYGCATNYLLNAKMCLYEEAMGKEHRPIDQCMSRGCPTYRLEGPRRRYLVEPTESQSRLLKIPIHVRRSNFRLPTSPKVPMIMIGPGTGVAPFRSFVQERVGLARKAKLKFVESSPEGASEDDALKDWAKMMLFYGCRDADQDFLYKDEWDGYARELGGKFEMFTAISRRPEFKGTNQKEYVQDLIKARREVVKKMIVDEKGYVFICGDGKYMLKSVEEVLRVEVFEHFGLNGNHELKFLKDRNRLLLDVWS